MRWIVGSPFDSPSRPLGITVICTRCYQALRCDDVVGETHRVKCQRCGNTMNVANIEPAAQRDSTT